MEHLKFWVNALMENLDTQVEPEVAERLIMACGRACANLGAVQAVERIRPDIAAGADLDAVLAVMNAHELGGGKLYREGATVYAIYERCYCPIVSAEMVTSPAFCDCTRGWMQAVFEAVLARPVVVTLEQSIRREADVCRVAIRV